ncbi:MAG: RHS repeat protein, partial [Candidatus Accumulibacter sp.]|nr:RHS repeat protein [Accumulibacter sp.]
YDAHGNRKQITDPEGNTTQATHNRLGLALTQTDAAGHLWRQTYDAQAKLKGSESLYDVKSCK